MTTKRLIRYTLYLLTVLTGIASLIIPLGSRQIAKNKKVLTDMEARILAIYEFQEKNSRLPTQEEADNISSSLPFNYSHYDYELNVNGSNNEEWSLRFWRGEWHETYNSSTKHNTLSNQATWWGFYGGFLFFPVIPVALFAGSRLSILQSHHQARNNDSESKALKHQ